MLKITPDRPGRTLLVEPDGPLTEADFAALSAAFDDLAGEDGSVTLVVHAPAFPGWADFAAFFAHADFVRRHEPRLAKLAVVSDSRVLEILPRIADLLLGTEVRRFPAADLAAAIAWAAEPVAETGGVEEIPGLPANVLGLSAHGVVSARDYASVIAPMIEARLKADPGRKLRLLYRLGPGFRSYTAGAFLADARLGLSHWSDFERVAVVTDVDWIARSARIFAPLIPAAVHVFPEGDFEEAKVWAAAS